MNYIATFDIGTTAIKAVWVGMDGAVIGSASQDIPTLFEGEWKEQDPRIWYETFCHLSKEHAPTEGKAIAIVMSGQMQDVIPVDANLQPVRNAILYSDARATAQAQMLRDALGDDLIQNITGNGCDGSLSLPKMMWLKEHEKDHYERTAHFLISAKDYVIAQLTGNCIGDYTACATAGCMDLDGKAWSESILKQAGIPMDKMPLLMHSHQKAGDVLASASSCTGYKTGTPVFAGVGDAGATTLASGISKSGEYNINLGTSGWVAMCTSKGVQCGSGVFHLRAMQEDQIISVVPFLNAGNVHKWITGLLSPTADNVDYEHMNTLLKDSHLGSGSVMALPYLVGERFPVLDGEVKGCFVGITPETSKADMARAMLEGVGYSILQGISLLGEKPTKVSIIGGGSRVAVWCQILADLLGTDVYVYKNGDIQPSRAIASAALIGLGIENDYPNFISSLQSASQSIVYHCNEENHRRYRAYYEKYLTLYPLIKAFYA